ncbi:epoxide hydrolase 2 isoform X2 [Populus alba]|uniref:epoxide hydrolase 2 isoform X2 n=1 Tax=Populus alba TaxID=43335 RepID=UPI003CC7434C
MELIKHTLVEVRGLKLHVAEIGTGPKVVLFLHGFPEIWYTWRYQMKAVAAAGYRAIAIDFRGYGLSEQPAEPEKGNFMDLVDDVVALLDTCGINKVFLIGKDFGSITAYLVAVVHPERVSGIVSLGIPFLLPGPNCIRNDLMPSGFYITRWQEPGRAEADFGRLDVKTVLLLQLTSTSTPLPPWFSEEDLAAYASLYEKSGFRFALQVPYRSLGIDCGITNPKVTAPTLLINGQKDYLLKFAGMEDYTKSEQLKHFVPDLDTVFLDEGNHFVHENLPKQMNELIITFLTKHCN